MSSSILKIVLFCKGRGAEASSYKPFRDETQWWSRRDALARCVSSALCSTNASSSSSSSCKDVELHLIFDEDWSHVILKYEQRQQQQQATNDFFPSEQVVVAMLKQLASSSQPGTWCRNGSGLVGRCFVNSKALDSSSILPSSMDSKRDVLNHLRKACSIEFMREKRMNASDDVVLRKTNKKQMMEVFAEWQKRSRASSIGNAKKQELVELKSVLNKILEPRATGTTIAGILHESLDSELPCFEKYAKGDQSTSFQICLFLGAVRDMTDNESSVLESCCRGRAIPLVKFRLGPVPEFTSKILAITMIHYANGLLGSAMARLHERKGPRPKQAEVGSSITPSGDHPSSTLHVIYETELGPDDVFASVRERRRAHWCLIRVIVTTLWRSRLASNIHNGSSLDVALSIVLSGGTSITLRKNDIVESLAEIHQAAPAEYQILQAVQKMAATHAVRLSTFMAEIAKSKDTLIVMEREGLVDMKEIMYKCSAKSASSSVTCILFRGPQVSREMEIAQESFTHQVVVGMSSASSAVDYFATSIVMIQHLFYQSRMDSFVSRLSKKRKNVDVRGSPSKKRRK